MMFVSILPFGMIEARASNKTLTSSEIVAYLEKQVGKSYPKSSCLAFVADCFQNLGATRSSDCCAYSYSGKCKLSTSPDIPIGADVFFSGGNVTCSNGGNKCGHIAIYVGKGYVIHATNGKVRKELLSIVKSWKTHKYIGWGYHLNVTIIAEASSYKVGWYQVDVVNSYINIRSGAGTNNSVVGQLYTGNKVEIDSLSGGWGRIKGTSSWICLDMCEITSALIAPSEPQVNLTTSVNFQKGSSVGASWSVVIGAIYYVAGLYSNNNTLIESKNVANGTNVSFIVPSAGIYKIKVAAFNSAGSNTGSSPDFTVYNPSKVTFKDWDGTILNTQNVNYGVAATAPEVPVREGYTFLGWDKEFTNLTSDLIINATYQINTYTIKFTDKDGNVLKTQKVPYGSDAAPPDNTNPQMGNVFVAWDSNNYLNVKSNATIQARYKWDNTALPIVATITSASRQSDGYYVYFNLSNYPNATTRGRAVVSLKTAQGKLVDTTESAAFSIPASGIKTGMEVFIPCDKAATQIEVIIVNSYSSGVPISLPKSTTIDQTGMWSNWSDTYPTGNVEIESRTEYQYQDKQFSTSSSNSKDDWTLYNTTSAWSDYGEWSPWTKTVATNSDTRKIETQTITDVAAYTQYNLFYYRYWNSSAGAYYYTYSSSMGGTKYTLYVPSTDVRYVDKFDGHNAYRRMDGYYNWSSEYWFLQTTQSTAIPAVTHTEWRYADRSLIKTYYFYQWSNWSEWSPNQVAATSERQVQTKTTYRYKSSAAALEDISGTTRTVSGKVDTTFSGKQATLFVYKIDEASDYTNEFVGQSVIGTDGSYSFTFKLREEPSIKTGDLTVALGIEGTTNTIIINTIVAPKPTYTIKFYDYDGTIVSTQTVAEGGDATLPSNLSRVGYTFVGWDTGITNIRDNLEINAKYVVNQYNVVFIDWTNDTVETKTFNYGDIIQGPSPTQKEGYDFIGWDAILDGTTVVSENMIITAKFEKKTYTVTFLGFNNEIISSQTVPYGEPAIAPNDLSRGNYVFEEWDNTNDFVCVKQNITVTPIYYYDETVATPIANVESGIYSTNQAVTLSCTTEGASIYYSIDGTDPSDEVLKYVNPIEVSESTELKFIAKANEKNDSDTNSKYYAINKSNMNSRWMPYVELPEHVLSDLADYNVISGTGHRYKDVQTTHLISTATSLGTAGWTNDGFVYGEFTEWSTTQPNEPNAYIDIQSKDPDPGDTPFYRYSHWKYFDDASQTYLISRVEIAGKVGQWEYTTLPNPLTVQGFEQGNPRYSYGGQNWYSQSIVIIGVVPDYKLYSYRYKEYSFSKWTDWSIAAIASGETRETQTDMIYQYNAPREYILTIDTTDGESNELVTADKVLDISLTDWQMEGYTFNGFFTDEACTQPWNLATDVVTGNITLYPKWSINEYSVAFFDANGMLLDSQTVQYGLPAAAPAVTPPAGYTFIGWDTAFNDVTKDLIVTAQYKLTSDLMKVSLNMASNVLTADSMFKLTATVTPAAATNKNITWTSSNEKVATVDQTGLVTAVSIGKATITATTEVDKQSASCEITVLSNGLWNFNFDETSNLKFICGLNAGNKVSELKAQINNQNVLFVDKNGDELGNNEAVGTGCKVQMIEADTVVSQKTFVLYGDVNCDGNIDSIDAGVVVDYQNYMIQWNPTNDAALLTAADVNGDGNIDSIDAGLLVDSQNYMVTINQSTGLATQN